MRDIDEDVFTNYTIKYCNNISSNIIIEDARTFSEFNAMVENDFIMIYLDISKEKQLERIMKTYPNNYNEHINNLNHVSKQDLINLPKNKFNLIINVDNDENHINKIIENFIDNIYK